MAYYEDGDRSERPEGSRNFPLHFPGPGEMRRASELYQRTGSLWDASYSNPGLKNNEDSRCGEPYQAPDYQEPAATQNFPAYGSASPWRETTYPFAQGMAAGTPQSPNPEDDSEGSISPKKPKVVLPPTRAQQCWGGQTLVGVQGRRHTRLPSYIPQSQDQGVSHSFDFSPGFPTQPQIPDHPRPTLPASHPRPWERNVKTPPGFPSRNRPDSCPPGLQPQGRNDIRPPPGFTDPAHNRNAASPSFFPSQGQSGSNFTPSRHQIITEPNQVIVNSPTFNALYRPIQARPNYRQHRTPQHTAPPSPMGRSVTRQEEQRSSVPMVSKHERQRKLDLQAKGFDSDDDDAFYPHND
ncbi:hypothetical protein F4776DRAFT_676660 [Hypoxylon sp. NC0597]|nr:hypothetical protein F4776DRAFT_676660 [Hypoxylon sp. NC0597]